MLTRLVDELHQGWKIKPRGRAAMVVLVGAVGTALDLYILAYEAWFMLQGTASIATAPLAEWAQTNGPVAGLAFLMLALAGVPGVLLLTAYAVGPPLILCARVVGQRRSR